MPAGFADTLYTDADWTDEHWQYWQQDWHGFAELFFSELLHEPHSTKQREDCVGWAMDAGGAIVQLNEEAPLSTTSKAETEAILDRVSCPVLAIHGSGDRCTPWELSGKLAELTSAEVLTLDGAGHLPQAREPVVINRAIRDFADRFRPPSARTRQRTWTRPLNRPKRVLYMSSPIGLGHARRDLAIADELRALRPGLEVHWLAQHPVTELLHRRSELVHPASQFLASESGHIESRSRRARSACVPGCPQHGRDHGQ